jgi:sirohydrochlorin cobaltochelatase
MPAMTNEDCECGLLLVGHGTRSEIGTAQFLALADRLSRRVAPLAVEPAFLEMRQPDIDAAVGRLLDRSASRLLVAPLLLFAAGHAKEDIPASVKIALSRRSRGEVQVVQAGHLGCHEALVELSRMRMEQAEAGFRVQGSGFSGGEGTGDRGQETGDRSQAGCLLLVGRGSRDDAATAEMYEFARRREPPSGEIRTEVAFLAMAQPLLHQQLRKVASAGYRRVIVQPHLLFHGDLVDSLKRQVAEVAAEFPATDWTVASVLADLPAAVTRGSELLENVILDRCWEAGIRVVALRADD